jgi:hypothetical protein
MVGFAVVITHMQVVKNCIQILVVSLEGVGDCFSHLLDSAALVLEMVKGPQIN